MEQSILTDEQLAELNPEGIEINTVIDDTTSQDTFNTDTIDDLNDGEYEIENVESAVVEEESETDSVEVIEQVEESTEPDTEVEGE